MPLYEISDTGLVAHDRADFVALGLYERADLQRLLREDISALGDDLLVVAEEFGQWEDARRRIDLLAIDRDAHLVVIELKRTTEGGHMELQALRYAAMVSSMRFEEVAAAYTAHAAKHRPGEEVDARAELLAWLDAPDGEDEVAISSDVRIILVSADFGREITTAVLWLNRFDGMDIRCVRLVPYQIEGRILLDIQQVVPLPEGADYQVRLRRKDQQHERVTSDGRDFTRYHIVVDGQVMPNSCGSMMTRPGWFNNPKPEPSRSVRPCTALKWDAPTTGAVFGHRQCTRPWPRCLKSARAAAVRSDGCPRVVTG